MSMFRQVWVVFWCCRACWQLARAVVSWLGGWPGPGWAEEAGERRDGLEQQGVDAGLLVGGVAGAELGDGAAVLVLGGELADPGGDGRGQVGGRAAWRGAASRG
jgi:hypothetical protein